MGGGGKMVMGWGYVSNSLDRVHDQNVRICTEQNFKSACTECEIKFKHF